MLYSWQHDAGTNTHREKTYEKGQGAGDEYEHQKRTCFCLLSIGSFFLGHNM